MPLIFTRPIVGTNYKACLKNGDQLSYWGLVSTVVDAFIPDLRSSLAGELPQILHATKVLQKT